jgi:Fic family protein
LLGAFEKYLHAHDRLPHIVRAGLLHVQFETIHPYLDGNGRIGRLLVALLFEHWKLLRRPLLYLSLFFKRHRDEYYRRLTGVRTDGDWEGWLRFFLEGVDTIATEAVASARELFTLVANDRARLIARRDATIHALRLFELLPKGPILSAASVVKRLDVAAPTAHRAIETLVKSGVLVETTGKKRDRSFAYHAYLECLREGTELDHGPGP